MKKTDRKVLVLALCAAVMMALTVGAGQAFAFTWNFAASPGGDSGVTSKTYSDTTSTYSILASGFINANPAPTSGTWTLANASAASPFSPNKLFEKFTSGDPGETGLGLTGEPNSEIQVATLIQLDLANLIANNLKNEQLIIGSMQQGEAFAVFGSNDSAAVGKQGAFLGGLTGMPEIQTLSIPGAIQYRYQWITATNVDVLLDNGLVFTGVPEPATMLLLGIGLVGLAGIRRKLKK